jgi:formylglycine-generating enzyme required for sulfatase activity
MSIFYKKNNFSITNLFVLIFLTYGQSNVFAEAEMKPGSVFKDCPNCPEMVVIPPGSYDRGSENGEEDEKPVQHVTIAKSFALGKTEITQGQWKAIMGNNPSGFKQCGDNCPVEKVSWDDAQVFIKKLNAKTGKQYRLPTEAEWEYACLGGEKFQYCGSDDLNSVAWFGAYLGPNGNSGAKTHPVAAKAPNAFGLYDMNGNVFEWVEDSFHPNYNKSPVDGSIWQGNGYERVLRGGSWNGLPQDERAAGRERNLPVYRDDDDGFRVARNIP